MQVIAVVALCIVSTLGKPNGYYSHHEVKPDIRIESYSSAPPMAKPIPADPPMKTHYGYQAPPSVVVVADTPKVMTTYDYQAPASTVVVADTPKGDYGYGHTSSFKTIVPTATIVRQVVSTDNAGHYNLQTESSDGTTMVESGHLKNLGHPEGPAQVKEGSYSFTSPEGKRFTVTYTADERGFIAKGDHLPTPPPISEEILKSLALPRVHHDSYGYSTVVADTPVIKSYY